MKKSKKITNKSVLVLGWEFPPRMVGGLAIATYGLVEALSHYIQVHLIIPYADEETPQIENVTIYGLNQMEKYCSAEELELISKNELQFSKKQEIFAYPLFESEGQNFLAQSQIGESENNIISYLDFFKSTEIYGSSLWQKLSVFSQLVIAVAKKIDFDIIHCQGKN